MSMNQVLPMFPIAQDECPLSRRGRDLAQRGGSQGGRGGHGEAHVTRHVCYDKSQANPQKKKKEFLLESGLELVEL